jgi:hypothetical protein
MKSASADSYVQETIEQLFSAHEDILYIAAVNDKLDVAMQKGLLDLHPSKLHMLHVQAALLVGMSSVWSESLGHLDYVSASFDAVEVVVMALPDKMYLIAVISCAGNREPRGTKDNIVKQFRSIQIKT